MQMRVRNAITVIGAAVTILGGGWSQTASAAGASWVSCDFKGVAHMVTPMTMTTRHIRFTSVVHFSACSSSVAGVSGGLGRTTGAFDGSCATAVGTAVQRIVWANHRASVVHATFVNAGPEIVRESVDRGMFRGASGGNVNAVVGPPSALFGCTGAGVTTATFIGHVVMSG
ncbi:MAG: hypothetical protein ACTHK4_01285 [Mycobacteriales bacterium]